MRFNRPVKNGLPESRREFAESLRQGARDSGLTSDQIARRAHATKGAVSQAMSGTRVPSQSLFRSLVRAMGQDPLHPRWLALYAAAVAAVLVWLVSWSGGGWLSRAFDREPDDAYRTPVVRVEKNAKVYQKPTGAARVDKVSERKYLGEVESYNLVCVPDGDPHSRRYGFLSGSTEWPLVYVDVQDLVIPERVRFRPCPAVVRIAPEARLYVQGTGGERADPATERAYSGVKLTEDSVCREGSRRYGLHGRSAEPSLVYVGEDDVTIPSSARLKPCPVVVRIAEDATFHQGPAGDRPADSPDDWYFPGDVVSPTQMCVAEADSSSPGPQRYGFVLYDGDSPSAYVDEKDLLIPPTARFDPCPPVLYVKKGAKIYRNETGNEWADQATEQAFSDSYVDPDTMCSLRGGPASPEPRRLGIRDRSYGDREPFAYVGIEDVVIPPGARLFVCP
ncbi:helix-turn-helix domain-containing protein [Streptomyces sp. S3(2020)]|uniref:helix-turn-helix domain-containing protein n=1 Tax=Streptomyces sp. S3(2020) TaxID=2732044 RepID=UPI001488909E|nr:helix-turn-helix transcriptional regulator [Streptomyces sp. S3(2020)]NNN37460.1 helix-turn-helix domain-containing protein [Streptomyces sp. S3(2020)]